MHAEERATIEYARTRTRFFKFAKNELSHMSSHDSLFGCVHYKSHQLHHMRIPAIHTLHSNDCMVQQKPKTIAQYTRSVNIRHAFSRPSMMPYLSGEERHLLHACCLGLRPKT